MKMSISHKIIACIAIILAMNVISSLVNIFSYQKNFEALMETEREIVNEMLYGKFAEEVILTNLGYMDAIVDRGSGEIDADIIEKHNQFYSWFEKNQGQYRESIKGTPYEKEWDKTIEDVHSLQRVGGELFEAIRRKAPDEKFAEIDDVLDAAMDRIVKRHGEVVAFSGKKFKASVEETVSKNEWGYGFQIVSFIFSTLVGIVLAIFLVHNINSLLKVIATKIGASSTVLQDAFEGVTKNSQSLSSATTQQAASLQQTAASVNEINAMVNRNAESAKQSEEVSARSIRAAESGAERINEMYSAIEAISENNKEIMGEMAKSNSQFAEISTIISDISDRTKIINDIVFQTKLLSFNASVEAARAGEHGKGFAVVAEEIGNLASMSGSAADEISNMLDQSIKNVDHIVDTMKKSVEVLVEGAKSRVSQGIETAQLCRESFEEIRENVVDVNKMIIEISTASSEQSSGVSEINNAITQLDSVTQMNANSANEVADVATQMSGQSDQLTEVSDELLKLVGASGRHAA